MALTFTSWTAYTDDDGNARTLSWANPVGCVTRAHGEAIRQAIVERCGVTGDAVPVVLSVDVSGSPLDYTWASAIDGLLTVWTSEEAMAPSPWGNASSRGAAAFDPITGGLSLTPRWTATRMAVVAGARILSLQHSPVTGAWIKQQYEMLRRMQDLVVPFTSAGTELTEVGNEQYSYGVYPSWIIGWTAGHGFWPTAFGDQVGDLIHIGAPYNGSLYKWSYDYCWNPNYAVACQGTIYGVPKIGSGVIGVVGFVGFSATDLYLSAEYQMAQICPYGVGMSSTTAPHTVTAYAPGRLNLATPDGLWGWECGAHELMLPIVSPATTIFVVDSFDVPGGFTFQGS